MFYGPRKDPVRGISMRFSGYPNYKAVWTTYSYLVQILKQALHDKPHIIHFDFTLTIFGSSYIASLPLPFLILLLKLAGCKVAITVHDVVTKEALGEVLRSSSLKYLIWLISLVFYRLLGFADVLIVHLRALERMLVKLCRVDPKKVSVVPFGVAPTTAVSKQALDRWRRKFPYTKIVLCFGWCSPRKGIEHLIDGYSLIAEKFPDSCLIIAGPTDSKYRSYLDYLRRKCEQLLPDSGFSFLGYVGEQDAHALFRLCRVVILPYLYMYASPSILYWSMQHRRPVIASKIEAFLEELEGYPESLLVRPRDSVAIAKALEKILTDDGIFSEASRFMERKALSYSWDYVAGLIYVIYQRLLSE